MKPLPPFHLAIPVRNIKEAQDFYGNLLNFQEGRSSSHWIDYNFFGHQLVVHLDNNMKSKSFNPVDGKDVPIPHFGIVLAWKDWQLMKKKLESVNIDFIIEPYIRFVGEPGEQATMFFHDPAGNALEFKAFNDLSALFVE